MNINEIINQYNQNGYAIIENFLTNEEVQQLLNESKKFIEQINIDEKHSIFSTSKYEQNGDEYFINSVDKIRFFFEANALNENGELIVNKENCLNKIGHALHQLNPIFNEITFSEKVQLIVKNIGLVKPIIPQSMFIFKNPKIGGQVATHQDSSFLHTTPEDKLIGLWFPLEDATIENGCLWFIPGSHKERLYTRYIRNPDKCPRLIFTNETPNFEQEKFVAVPVKKGSCVLIHGLVVHKSETNLSDKARPAYTFHCVDTENTVWSQENWLQENDQYKFPHLFN